MYSFVFEKPHITKLILFEQVIIGTHSSKLYFNLCKDHHNYILGSAIYRCKYKMIFIIKK